jgi:hypothetical protein
MLPWIIANTLDFDTLSISKELSINCMSALLDHGHHPQNRCISRELALAVAI